MTNEKNNPAFGSYSFFKDTKVPLEVLSFSDGDDDESRELGCNATADRSGSRAAAAEAVAPSCELRSGRKVGATQK